MIANPVLIVAHPGHELRLFHWMERRRPTVHVLTDGSGATAGSRLPYTAQCLQSAGARPGTVFGSLTDRDCYQAMMNGDAEPFLTAAESIAGGLAPSVELLVCDPVEGYNPTHDLCFAVAVLVQALFWADGGDAELATYPLTRALASGNVVEVLKLDASATERKQSAIEAYDPLRADADALLEQTPEALSVETLRSVRRPGAGLWPGEVAPSYERIGRERVRLGRYRTALTYPDHVRPIADALFARADTLWSRADQPGPRQLTG